MTRVWGAHRAGVHPVSHDVMCPHVFHLGGLLCWILTTPVQFYVGSRFYRGAYASVRNGAANMDVLVALGTSVAYFYSVYIIFDNWIHPESAGMHFFETAAMLIMFLTMGKMLESKAKGKTSQAVEELMKLQPNDCVVLDLDDEGNVLSEERVARAAPSPFASRSVQRALLKRHCPSIGDSIARVRGR